MSCKNCRKPLEEILIESKTHTCLICGKEITHYNRELNFWDKIKIKINTWRNKNER
tara:strand:+ start:3607 stop:3774 length:168 start_codon:yes stop_codon:yes gene_type:complete